MSTQMLAITDVVPNGNYRKTMDEKALLELQKSIMENGLLQPIVVQTKNDKGQYKIIAGERRYRASKAAGLKEIEARIISAEPSEALLLSITENDQREDVNPMEQALGYAELLKLGEHTYETLAEAIGKSPGYVLGRLKLANLPKEIQAPLLKGKITMGHAMLLSRIGNLEDQKAMLKNIFDEDLTIDELRRTIGDYSCRLNEAPFDTKECKTCQSRGINQAILFPEAAKEKDRCLNAICFDKKTEKHLAELAQGYRDAKVTVINTPEGLATAIRAKNTHEISEDPKSFNYPKKYATVCTQCPKRVFFATKEKSNYRGEEHRFRFRSGFLCQDRDCFTDMNTTGKKKKAPDKKEAPAPSAKKTMGEPTQATSTLRNEYLIRELTPKVGSSETLALKLAIYYIVKAFEKFSYLGKPDAVLKAIMEKVCTVWKSDKFMDDHAMFSRIQTIANKDLLPTIVKLMAAAVQFTGPLTLVQMMGEAKVDPAKTLKLDESYLNSYTKDELVEFAKAHGIKVPQNFLDLKKSEMVPVIQKAVPVGTVPKDFAAITKPYAGK